MWKPRGIAAGWKAASPCRAPAPARARWTSTNRWRRSRATTPNCIRTTCYDALSLDYNVVLLEDCTSSRTPGVQAANIEDMAFIGAHIMTCDEFCERGLANVADVAGGVREACFEEAAR